jgi:hypothetical protein
MKVRRVSGFGVLSIVFMSTSSDIAEAPDGG